MDRQDDGSEIENEKFELKTPRVRVQIPRFGRGRERRVGGMCEMVMGSWRKGVSLCSDGVGRYR